MRVPDIRNDLSVDFNVRLSKNTRVVEMITIMTIVETLANITADGKLIVAAPAGLAPGMHRVKLSIEEAVISGSAASDTPRQYYKGRPVYTEEDRQHRDCPLPPEPEWEAEWKKWEAEQSSNASTL